MLSGSNSLSTPSISSGSDEEDEDLISMPTSIKIGRDTLTFGKILGAGGVGIVYSAQYKGEPVAVKVINYFGKRKLLKECEEEKDMMQTIKNLHIPHVVEMQCFANFSPLYYITMPYMGHGSLYDWVEKTEEPFKWSRSCAIMNQILQAVTALHKNGIVHRDIKGKNILLDEKFNAKLADFDMAKRIEDIDSDTHVQGTAAWLAPEVWWGGLPSEKSDVYSLAMLLWMLTAWKEPFLRMDLDDISSKVMKGEREKIPATCLPKASLLIRWGWLQEPRARPTAQELLTECQSDATVISDALTNVQTKLGK